MRTFARVIVQALSHYGFEPEYGHSHPDIIFEDSGVNTVNLIVRTDGDGEIRLELPAQEVIKALEFIVSAQVLSSNK